ncbi:MAG: hypothetical protein PVJ57_14820 [Phycisphaerae bacterium]|jgi:hypothetical protein
MRPSSKLARAAGWGGVLVLVLVLAGCAHVPNQFREDGPSVGVTLDSPTVQDVKSRVSPAEPTCRGWHVQTVSAESGAVTHWPLYFEDPFEDKGHGRTDQTHPGNVYHLGWEDYLAMPYGLARFTANWLMLPVSAVVTPPWTLMESDGKLSRQILGYDHDATRARATAAPEEPAPAEPPASQDEPAATDTQQSA